MGVGGHIVVVGVNEGETLELFRIVKTDQQVAALAESFMSSFALDRPPRGWERRAAVIQMGVSMFERREQAAATARRFPVIGGFLALVRLTAGQGFGMADTGPPGHMTVWGRPLQLLNAVVDISRVDQHG